MYSACRFVFNIGLVLSCLRGISLTAQLPGVSPGDCVQIKYITGLWMNMAGTQVAYLVKSPSVEMNTNEYQLYVKDVSNPTVSNGTLLMTGVEMSDIQWFDHDRRIALLVSIGGIKKLISIDLETDVSELAFPTDQSIGYFSMDAAGNTVTYSIPDPIQGRAAPELTAEQVASGYRIDFEELEKNVNGAFVLNSVYIRRRDARGIWGPPLGIAIENPFTHLKTMRISGVNFLSMSPDGKRIALQYSTDGIPDDWSKNPTVQLGKRNLALLPLPVLYDVDSGTTSLAFKMIFVYSKPVWSRDSLSFFINSPSPIGSRWEEEDLHDHPAATNDVNMFHVTVASGAVDEVRRHVVSLRDGPMFLLPMGDIVVQSSRTSIVRLHETPDGWREIDHASLPGRATDRFYKLTSNGAEIWGVHETVTTPDALFSYKLGQDRISLLTNLNPQYGELRTASVDKVQWTTSEGLNVSGLLFVPPGYAEGRRYPLVIQTKPNLGWFTCDFGPFREPSFAAQPLASAGIMYLVRTFDEGYSDQEDIEKRPKGYPGGISEAVQQMDIWDRAVDTLNRRGLIDDSRVGIIGFSRTGWQVEYDLVHSRVHYAAATATDNVQYDLSEYWLIPSFSNAADQMYGGPPYGRTLENWQKYSISFNLDKVHTPLLMEQFGYGVHGELENHAPVALAPYLEVATGLRRLKRPMEMYYYPDEVHQLDHPRALQSTLQRNVDWYRFWLQGYERPNPEDPEQYKRWEHLRELRDTDAKASALRLASPSRR